MYAQYCSVCAAQSVDTTFCISQYWRIWKTIPVSRWWSGSPPKFNHLFIGPLPTFPKISCKSIHKFLCKVANRQTDKQRWKHNLLGGGKNTFWCHVIRSVLVLLLATKPSILFHTRILLAYQFYPQTVLICSQNVELWASWQPAHHKARSTSHSSYSTTKIQRSVWSRYISINSQHITQAYYQLDQPDNIVVIFPTHPVIR